MTVVPTRRNVITPNDAIAITVVAALAGVAAAFAGCAPTGNPAVDAVLTVAVAAATTWLAASSPWWALLTAAGLALAASLGSSLPVTAMAFAAVVGAAWIAAARANRPVIRAVVGALTVQVLFRLDFDPFFLASAAVAAVAVGVVAATGALRRQRYVRKRILWVSAVVVLAGFAACVGLGAALLQQRTALTSGYRSMLLGLELVQTGDSDGARAALESAARDLDAADSGLSGVLGQPARVVPGLAQNRAATVALLGGAAMTAAGASQALATVDLDRLRVVDGVIDVAALSDLAQPFAELDAAVQHFDRTLRKTKSDWLVAPLQERIATSLDRAERIAPQSAALAATAQMGADMLGANGPRRYLLAFVNGAEARGQSGLMGNWSELTIDRGRMEVTRSGVTKDLSDALTERDVFIDQTDEFFRLLGPVGAGEPPDTGVDPNLWGNITSSPDMVTVGDVMAQLYEVEAGYAPDGVVVIDPAGIAALLAITGPVQIEELAEPLTKDNVERFLLIDQYEFADGDRKDLLASVTDAAVENILRSTLPLPQQFAATMADAALHGHISAWASRPEEQDVFELVGMDARLPPLGGDGWTGDAVAVLSDNANPNKIDSFLERDVTYAAAVDEEAGVVESTLTVLLSNNAPSDGFEDYVIGNAYGLPRGTNRTLLSVMSPHEVVEFRVDGVLLNPLQLTTHGWNVRQFLLYVPPGGSTTVQVDYRGTIKPGPYQLLLRPQPLPNADEVTIEVDDGAGAPIVRYSGPVLRRSVLDAEGISAWR